MNPRDQILILGGATHKNRGDRAMHEGLLRWLRQEVPDARPVFLASNPELTAEVLNVDSRLSPDGLLAQPWTRETPSSTRQRLEAWWRGMKFALRPPGDFSEHLSRARAVFVPGSGSMNSLWWHDWLYVKAAEIHAARRAGVPVFMSSQGIGPVFTHWMDRRVALGMFRRCARVGVRDDAQSIDLLTELGLQGSQCLHTGDDALLIPPDHRPSDRILAGVPKWRQIVGLNVRNSSSYGRRYAKPQPKLWAEALRALLEQGVDAHFVFIPISYDAQDDDRVAARQVADLMPEAANRITLIEEELDAAALRGLATRCHVAAGISYHFLLFCLAASVPTLGVWQNPYYQQKQGGLFRLYDIPEAALDLAALDGNRLKEAIQNLLDQHDSLSDQLRSWNQKLGARAREARQTIVGLLGTMPPHTQSPLHIQGQLDPAPFASTPSAPTTASSARPVASSSPWIKSR